MTVGFEESFKKREKIGFDKRRHIAGKVILKWNTAQQKEAPTLHNGMNGTREHYAKCNKPGGERQIPYDLTYKWNLINKTNKLAKCNQRQ